MNKMILLFLLSSLAVSAQEMQMYNNPVLRGDYPDPSVIRVGKDYYASATTSDFAPCYPLFHSRDLVNWKRIGAVFNHPPEWIKGDCWAPELFYHKDLFYVYYTARRKSDNVSCIGVATARNIKKGFTDHGIIVEWGKEAIDAFVFKDDDGKLYISWKAYGLDARPIEIVASELSDDGLSLKGEVFSLTRHDKGWTGKGDEGHCIVKHGGYYYLFYSVGGCCDNKCDYRVEVARSKSLREGFVQYDKNPILQGGEFWKCSGHGTLVQTPENKYFYLYHAYHHADFEYVGRQGLLDEVLWDGTTGYPYFRQSNTPSSQAEVPFKHTKPQRSTSFFDSFTSKEKAKYWSRDMNLPDFDLYFQGLSPETGNYTMKTCVKNRDAGFAGLCIYGDRSNLLAWGTKNGKIELLQWENGAPSNLFSLNGNTSKIYLKIESVQGRFFRFYYSSDAGEWHVYPQSGEYFDGAFLPQWGKGIRCGILTNGKQRLEKVFSYFSLE